MSLTITGSTPSKIPTLDTPFLLYGTCSIEEEGIAIELRDSSDTPMGANGCPTGGGMLIYDKYIGAPGTVPPYHLHSTLGDSGTYQLLRTEPTITTELNPIGLVFNSTNIIILLGVAVAIAGITILPGWLINLIKKDTGISYKDQQMKDAIAAGYDPDTMSLVSPGGYLDEYNSQKH